MHSLSLPMSRKWQSTQTVAKCIFLIWKSGQRFASWIRKRREAASTSPASILLRMGKTFFLDQIMGAPHLFGKANRESAYIPSKHPLTMLLFHQTTAAWLG